MANTGNGTPYAVHPEEWFTMPPPPTTTTTGSIFGPDPLPEDDNDVNISYDDKGPKHKNKTDKIGKHETGKDKDQDAIDAAIDAALTPSKEICFFRDRFRDPLQTDVADYPTAEREEKIRNMLKGRKNVPKGHPDISWGAIGRLNLLGDSDMEKVLKLAMDLASYRFDFFICKRDIDFATSILKEHGVLSQ